MIATIDIPAVTDKLISTNQRHAHWSQRAKPTRLWREAAYTLALPVKKTLQTPIPHRVHILAYVYLGHNRPYDAHNYNPTAKAAVDGLVSAGLLTNDTNTYVLGPDMRQGDQRARPGWKGLILTLENAGPLTT